jgi:phage shock protein C
LEKSGEKIKLKMAKVKKLTRDLSDKIIGGVASGFANYFNIDPTMMRAIFVIVIILTGLAPGIITYLILWILIPGKH